MTVPEHHRDRTPHTPAVLCVTIASTLPAARCVEQSLARLCAEDLIDIFDGVVVRWPADAPVPLLRPLRNLPRIAAFADDVWGVIGECAGGRRDAVDPVCAAAARLYPGAYAIFAVCARTDGVWLIAEGRRYGVAVTSTPIDVARYSAPCRCRGQL